MRTGPRDQAPGSFSRAWLWRNRPYRAGRSLSFRPWALCLSAHVCQQARRVQAKCEPGRSATGPCLAGCVMSSGQAWADRAGRSLLSGPGRSSAHKRRRARVASRLSVSLDATMPGRMRDVIRPGMGRQGRTLVAVRPWALCLLAHVCQQARRVQAK